MMTKRKPACELIEEDVDGQCHEADGVSAPTTATWQLASRGSSQNFIGEYRHVRAQLAIAVDVLRQRADLASS